jgi:AraC family transcriptional regulator
LYGDARGGSLVEHAHPETQVSVHFERRVHGQITPSHVHLYASQQRHTGGWNRNNEIVVFQFTPALLVETRQELGHGTDFDLVPRTSLREPVLESLGSMVRDEYTANRSSGLYIESVAHLMARYLLRKHAVFPVPEGQRYSLSNREFLQIRRFIDDNLRRGFSVRELAASIGVGPGILAQKLAASAGKSPWRYVEEQRILRAKALLRSSTASIAEIAVQLGYADQSHFTNAFRRATGITPKNYRTR